MAENPKTTAKDTTPAPAAPTSTTTDWLVGFEQVEPLLAALEHFNNREWRQADSRFQLRVVHRNERDTHIYLTIEKGELVGPDALMELGWQARRLAEANALPPELRQSIREVELQRQLTAALSRPAPAAPLAKVPEAVLAEAGEACAAAVNRAAERYAGASDEAGLYAVGGAAALAVLRPHLVAAPLADAELAEEPWWMPAVLEQLEYDSREFLTSHLDGLLARLAATEAGVSRWVPESEARDGKEYRGLVPTATGWREGPVVYRTDMVRRGWYHALPELRLEQDVRFVLLEAPRPALPAAPTANAGKEPQGE